MKAGNPDTVVGVTVPRPPAANSSALKAAAVRLRPDDFAGLLVRHSFAPLKTSESLSDGSPLAMTSNSGGSRLRMSQGLAPVMSIAFGRAGQLPAGLLVVFGELDFEVVVGVDALVGVVVPIAEPGSWLEHPATAMINAALSTNPARKLPMTGHGTERHPARPPDGPTAYDPQMPSPDITPEMRASAKTNPNTWLYVIDPLFESEADVPPWGVVGAYPVDATGEIEDASFQANDKYRPSPQALRMPAPAGPLDELLQLIRTGHRPPDELPPVLRTSTLLLYAAAPNQYDVVGFPDPDGRVFVPVCTAEEHVPAAWPGWRFVTGADLGPLLDGYPLLVNPIGPISAIVPAGHLTA